MIHSHFIANGFSVVIVQRSESIFVVNIVNESGRTTFSEAFIDFGNAVESAIAHVGLDSD